MTKNNVPGIEGERLAALREYDILDTMQEKDFDDVTKLASVICGTPIALISLVDQDRQWFKSHLGLDAGETHRDFSFCSHAIKRPDEFFTVFDARDDARFRDNPLVTGDPNIVFYAGMPLVDEDGYALGTVCVIDRKPRTLDEDQRASLKILADQVMAMLALRKVAGELRKINQELSDENFRIEIDNRHLSGVTELLEAQSTLIVQLREENITLRARTDSLS